MTASAAARALLVLPPDYNVPAALRAGAAAERAEWGDPVLARTYPRSHAAHMAAAALLDALAMTTEVAQHNLSSVMTPEHVARWALRHLPAVAEAVVFAHAVREANQA